MSTSVLLLRAPAGTPDRYETAFSAAGHLCTSLPVLETALVNGDALRTLVREQGRCTYDAVIITSARACEAWGAAVDSLEDGPTQGTMQASDWTGTPFYVVGSTTATALAAIRAAHPQSPYAPSDVRGESSGTSQELARFVLQDLGDPPHPRPLLYLTGDKNRDTLPDILAAGGHQLHTVQVYETRGSSRFREDLDTVLRLPIHRGTALWWIVFFAPSSSEFTIPFLQEHFDLRGVDNRLLATRIASIGPTTTDFLRETAHLTVHAMASKPTPQHLLEAIQASDSGLHR
ncbi:unnamed protein product [Mycena citricolor]|uniref:Tetrapyrrole biosynthesis uroporphyrinogen III synthase domain-containing protein n=1 Tax=Mycena citricolor TaxID=2018698 RepID=A0AAD2H4B1_9AGAR|nr:unnamed protein product [Mycena citricolor]